MPAREDAGQSDKTIVTEAPTDMLPAAGEPAPTTAPEPPVAPAAPLSSEARQSSSGSKEGLDGKRMSLLAHLAELRTRLRNAAIAFVLAMIGSFVLVERYFDWLTRPVRKGMKDAGHNLNFYAKSLTEPFWVYM